jgi:GDPmannose 4,6-dehydratase
MWLMLQQPEADDFVLATGESHSVREFVERAFLLIARSIVWRGQGLDEVGIDAKSGEVLVQIDPRYFRPTEVDALIGDPRKANQQLGWRPSIGFDEMIREMVEADLQRIESTNSFRHE